MKSELTKIITLLLISISSLCAEEDANVYDSCCDPYFASDACGKCAQIWPTRGPDWIITPNAGPCVACGWDAHITGAFIYWTAREDHLGFAYKEGIQNGNSVTNDGTIKKPDWNFEPGFKVGVGVLKDHDGWDVYANYTWLVVRNTKNSVSTDDPQTGRITPIGDPFAAGGLSDIENISGSWRLDLNVVDLELGRNFFISRYLLLRPNFGLKGAWIDQSFRVDTIGISGNTPSLGQNRDRIDSWGIGIEGGLDTSWHINRCFSFYGDVAITALWEKFEVKSKSRNAPLNGGPNSFTTLLDVENNFFTIKPILELSIGFEWETWFCCDCYHFSIRGGWEQQWWADQNQFFAPTIESREGDLSLQGLTIQIRIDF